jgi:AraC family transcriptional regulator
VEPRIVTQPAFEVVGLEIETSPKSPEIPALWGRFAARMSEIADAIDPQIGYGVIARFDRERSRLSYLAGVAVKSAAHPPQGMVMVGIPGGEYAVFESSLTVIGATFDHIFGVWLPQAPYRLGSGPYYERYGETFDPEDPTSLVTIHIPVIASSAAGRDRTQ